MIIVTGGAGMIGSNLISALNQKGYTDILVVDDLSNGHQFKNLVNLSITDYMDKDDFLAQFIAGTDFGQIKAVFHQGACSSTTEWDGKFMMLNNYEYSKKLLHCCLDRSIPFIYASSAATYGDQSQSFIEEPEYEGALNVYGYSKQLFDNYVRYLWRHVDQNDETISQITGLKYFNVYGPNEQHKGSMASVAFHLNKQLCAGENLKLFEGSHTFKRDFIYVEDVCDVNLWFMESGISGLFNCGTGIAESFQSVAEAVIKYHGTGTIESIPFPEHLKNAYQKFTQADLTKLRSVGCDIQFKSVEEGVYQYLSQINQAY